MKNVLLFTILIGLGFTGGSLFPDVMADAENSKAEENCNCGCGPTEVKVMMVPAGSDMALTTGLIEAISNDIDNTLTQEELVTIINKVEKDLMQTTELSAVKGVSTGSPSDESNTTVSSYEKIINSFLSGNLTTSTDTQKETETIAEQSESVSGTSSIILNEETTKTKKTKNNNGLGNGSEPADVTSNDVKGIDPSNPGKRQKTSTKSTSSKTEVKSSNSSSGKNNSSKSIEKKEKVKNNNGLGNGSEPADGTSTDIKGIDPSNPGNGGSKNNAGNK